MIFRDQQARNTLEGILHPRINQYLHEAVARLTDPYALLVIPLLAETWPQYQWTDRVLVVDIPDTLQMQRLLARDGIQRDMAEHMLQAQASRQQRLALADDVIDNSGDMTVLDDAVRAMHQQYLLLVQERA